MRPMKICIPEASEYFRQLTIESSGDLCYLRTCERDIRHQVIVVISSVSRRLVVGGAEARCFGARNLDKDYD